MTAAASFLLDTFPSSSSPPSDPDRCVGHPEQIIPRFKVIYTRLNSVLNSISFCSVLVSKGERERERVGSSPRRGSGRHGLINVWSEARASRVVGASGSVKPTNRT